jgi:hypothetical protein
MLPLQSIEGCLSHFTPFGQRGLSIRDARHEEPRLDCHGSVLRCVHFSSAVSRRGMHGSVWRAQWSVCTCIDRARCIVVAMVAVEPRRLSERLAWLVDESIRSHRHADTRSTQEGTCVHHRTLDCMHGGDVIIVRAIRAVWLARATGSLAQSHHARALIGIGPPSTITARTTVSSIDAEAHVHVVRMMDAEFRYFVAPPGPLECILVCASTRSDVAATFATFGDRSTLSSTPSPHLSSSHSSWLPSLRSFVY